MQVPATWECLAGYESHSPLPERETCPCAHGQECRVGMSIAHSRCITPCGNASSPPALSAQRGRLTRNLRCIVSAASADNALALPILDGPRGRVTAALPWQGTSSRMHNLPRTRLSIECACGVADDVLISCRIRGQCVSHVPRRRAALPCILPRSRGITSSRMLRNRKHS